MWMEVDGWDLMVSFLDYSYIINHHHHPILGDHNNIEVLTGLDPDSAAKVTLYAGTNMKDTVKYLVEKDQVVGYCDGLVMNLDRLHEQVRDHVKRSRSATKNYVRSITALQQRGPSPGHVL